MADGERVGIVIQARMGSKRLAGKVLIPIAGEPMLRRLFERVSLSRLACSVSVATASDAQNGTIVDACLSWGVPVTRGPEQDLTTRLLLAARTHELTALVRVTADNPLTDPNGIDELIERYLEHGDDFVHNHHPAGYPYGTGAELMKVAVLERCDAELTDIIDRELVFLRVRERPERFSCHKLNAPAGWLRPDYFLTVDHPEDLALVERIYRYFGLRNDMELRDIVELLDSHPTLPAMNAHLHEPLRD